jgi:NAD(P)H-dependent flavin oxidoreductase YrpB (nitropropane dioxygenase family)
MLKTRLCQLLGLKVPIILAPMGRCTSAQLVAALSK